MKSIEWNQQKNDWLYDTRGVRFEEVEERIRNKKHWKASSHPNQKKHPDQKIFLVEIKEYIWCVPYVEEEKKIFLKTVFPSRKHTKQWRKELQMKGKVKQVKENAAPYSINPFSMPLDEEEQWIEDHMEEFVPLPHQEEELRKLQEAAIHTLNKNKNINIRIKAKDLFALKDIAAEEGMPYQTLVGSILHKFIRSYKKG